MKLEIPSKHWFKIGEVSKIVDVDSHIIRYWEKELRILQVEKTKSGQRIFRCGDIETIALVKLLLHEKKFTIAGAEAQILSCRERGLSFDQIVASLLGPTPAVAVDAAADEGVGQLALSGPGFEPVAQPASRPREREPVRRAEEWEALRAERDEACEQLAQARDELEELRRAVAARAAETAPPPASHREEFERLRAELVSLRENDAEQRETIDRLAGELQNAEASTDVLEALEARNAALEAELDTLRASEAALRGAWDAQRAEFQRLQGHADALETALAEVERRWLRLAERARSARVGVDGLRAAARGRSAHASG